MGQCVGNKNARPESRDEDDSNIDLKTFKQIITHIQINTSLNIPIISSYHNCFQTQKYNVIC